MKFSDAKGQKVVSTSTAETVGKLHDLVVDSTARKVVGLVLKKTPGEGDTLDWASLTAFGTDAITVADASLITKPEGPLAELAQKRSQLEGKRVLTQSGTDLGPVKDLEFDPADGTVTALDLKGSSVAGSRLVATGSYAVIVSDE